MSLSSFHFFEKDDCCSFEDCEGSFKCGKDNCQGPAKNIPVGKVKETATAITLCKRNNCAKGTTFTDGEDCCSANCDGGNGEDGCCSEESPCGKGEGDLDGTSDCRIDLR